MKKTWILALCLVLAVSCGEKEEEIIPGRGDWTETPDKGDNKDENEGGEGNKDEGNKDEGNKDEGGKDEGGNDKPSVQVKLVAPTVELGDASEDVTTLKLTPGKLVGLNQVTNAVCNRAIAAGMHIDAMLSDGLVFNITSEAQENLFKTAGDALNATKAKFWGVHLPYKDSVKIQTSDEAKRVLAVRRQIRLMELSMKYLKPNHFVVHPGSGNYYTHETERFATAKSQCQQSLIAMQAALDKLNAQYGTKAILCVENCSRTVGYDGKSLLDLLSAPGLEKTRICLDTGHALMPMNGEWRDKSTGKATKEPDVVVMLKTIGTRLGTLHIQQNHGSAGKTSPTDEHIVPWLGGLIDWPAFYEALLKDCRYRGCFLYETTYEKTYNGEKSSIESCKYNHENVIYPAYQKLSGK